MNEKIKKEKHALQLALVKSGKKSNSFRIGRLFLSIQNIEIRKFKNSEKNVDQKNR